MRIFTTSLFIVFFIIASLSSLRAQQVNDPVAYMDRFSQSQQKINYEMLGYISAVAHNKSAKKVNKERTELIQAISAAKAKFGRPVDFEGDSAMRVASYNYFEIALIVLKQDYAKIMDLEEIAEESYDNMEAYLKAQEVANQKEHDAYERADREYRAFAAKHHVTIQEDDSKDAKASEKIAEVDKYYNKVYLAFFKCNSNESYLMKAIEKKDVSGIEQNRSSLLKNSEEALPKFAEIGSFDGDANLTAAAKNCVQFYLGEAKDKISILSDYIVQNDNFQKMKTAMDKKSASDRTQEDVDKYNAAIKSINDAVATYNKVNTELNQARTKLLNELNGATQDFMAKHIPKHK